MTLQAIEAVTGERGKEFIQFDNQELYYTAIRRLVAVALGLTSSVISLPSQVLPSCLNVE